MDSVLRQLNRSFEQLHLQLDQRHDQLLHQYHKHRSHRWYFQ